MPVGTRGFEQQKTILPPETDENGTVTQPAIDLATGNMANGQPIRHFYDRLGQEGRHRAEVVERMARRLAHETIKTPLHIVQSEPADERDVA